VAQGPVWKYEPTGTEITPRRDSLYYEEGSAQRAQDSILAPLNMQDSLMTTEDSPRGSPEDVSRRPTKKMPKRSMNMYEATQKLDDIQKKFGGGGFAQVKDQYGK
jgi:hypothetical protein